MRRLINSIKHLWAKPIREDLHLTWNNARAWQENANLKKQAYDEPKWSWDCGFKLDFDGSLLRVSSRFYPPHKNSSNKWEGELSFLLFDQEIVNKQFKCDTVDQLREEVEGFVDHYRKIIKSRL